jgi:hypothetical protein
MRIAAIMTEANSRLSRLQGEAEAATAMFAETSKLINAQLNTTKSPAAFAEWPRLYQENAETMVYVTRSWLDIVSHTQAEFAKVLGTATALDNAKERNYLDHFTRAIDDARSAAEADMKDFLAKTVGSAGETKPAKREKLSSLTKKTA